MEPYENLANAIIIQAAEDYRQAKAFLRENPRTEELEADVAARKAQREEEKAKREKGDPPVQRARSREEILLGRIAETEAVAAEVERFFLSRWFSVLTRLDGSLLLEQLKKEVEP